MVVLCMFAAVFTTVPGESFGATQSASLAAPTLADKVDINTADEAILSTLPGIGEKTATAITSYRKDNGNFKTIDDLIQVKGIGEKKLAQIRPYLKEI